MTAIDVEVQVGTAPLVDVDVQLAVPTFTVVSVLPTGPRGPAGPAGADGAAGPQGDPGPAGSDGVMTSVVAGANITVDATDPANPIVSSTATGTGTVESVVAGTNVTVDATDPANPIVSSSGGGSFPDFEGTGSPEGVVTADVGQSYVDTANGGVYVKGSGTATDMGWLGAVAVTPGLAAGLVGTVPGVHVDVSRVNDAQPRVALLAPNVADGQVAISDPLAQSSGGTFNELGWGADTVDGTQLLFLQLGSTGQFLWTWSNFGWTKFPGAIRADGAIGTSAGEPADADIQPGQCFRWFDATNGAARVCFKGKTLDGTVVESFGPMG